MKPEHVQKQNAAFQTYKWWCWSLLGASVVPFWFSIDLLPDSFGLSSFLTWVVLYYERKWKGDGDPNHVLECVMHSCACWYTSMFAGLWVLMTVLGKEGL
jgi:hypothetical protein